MPGVENKINSPGAPENCRTCVDFKSWAKLQRKSLSTVEVNFQLNCAIFGNTN